MATKNPIVQIRQGDLRGVREENLYGGHYFAFRGIPYAKPPVGNLRFKDSEPAESWSDVRDASTFGDVCAQLDFLTREMCGSDDCLYLNVYTNSMDNERKVPVMVWIHGGGFQMGSGNDDLYGADQLIRKDIILVTINYRVGALGFLNIDDEEAPGNQGLKDQVLALKWVQENIACFGGDPKNVTIFGESAGGSSVHYLLLSPLAEGLYHKAIMQSGAATTAWAHTGPNPTEYAYRLASELGKKTKDPKEAVEFLRTISTKDLINANSRILSLDDIIKLAVGTAPSIDRKARQPFLTIPVKEAALRGIRVPLLIGYNENEGAFFVNKVTKEFFKKVDEDFENIMDQRIVNDLKKEGISMKAMRKLYFGDGTISRECLPQYADFVSDIVIVEAVSHAIDIQMEQKLGPTYMYKFSFEPEHSPLKVMLNVTMDGATHADDLRYLFCPHLYAKMGLEMPKPGSSHYRVMEYFVEMWTDFARTGNPTPTKTDVIPVIWQPVGTGNTYNYLRIDEKLKMETLEKGVQRFNWKMLKHKL